MKLPTPGPSLLVAVLVLSVAAGGVGYAAGSLPKNSVGSVQLKKNAVTAKKIKTGAVTGDKVADGAVTGDKVADGALTGADLAAGAVTGVKVAPNSLGGAQIDESSLAVPVKPGSILLTGYDFRPRLTTYGYATDGVGDIYAVGATGDFTAPVRVPAGATVTGLRVFYLDNGPSSVDAFVGRFVPSAGTYLYSSSTSSSGTSGAVRTLELTPLPVVAGSTQNLTVYLPASSAYKLYGAQIDYQ